MSDAIARELMRAWWERAWGDGDLDVLDRLLVDPYVRHTSVGTETISVAAYKAKFVQYQRVMHRPVTTVYDEAIVGDRSWNRATSKGVNLETGDVAVISWFLQHRVAGGRIAETGIASLTGGDWGS